MRVPTSRDSSLEFIPITPTFHWSLVCRTPFKVDVDSAPSQPEAEILDKTYCAKNAWGLKASNFKCDCVMQEERNCAGRGETQGGDGSITFIRTQTKDDTPSQNFPTPHTQQKCLHHFRDPSAD